MKKITLLLGCTLMLFSFSACTKEKTTNNMSIDKAELTTEEKNIAELLGYNHGSSIYDFKVDDMVKTIQMNTYKLKDGKWELTSGGGGKAFDCSSGRIALTFENIGEGYRTSLQSEDGSSASEYTSSPTNEYENMSRATSILSNKTAIEYEKEIPLAIQIITSKNAVSSYNVEYFFQPEEYEKMNYEHVFAVTILFSQKELSELDDEIYG